MAMTTKLNKEMDKKFKKMHEDALLLWENKEIRFDTSSINLGLHRGEILVDCINGVEDTKGNNGVRGILIITSLRVIWYSEKSAKTNLSIGYDCINNIEIKTTKSRLRGSAQALFLRTRYKDVRYEFIFTSLVENSPRLFTSFQATVRSYDSSKLFRDFKIRGAIVKNRDLVMLPGEEVLYRSNNVWNISSEQGNVGTYMVTNIRVVWFASVADSFNISLPFVQVKSITKKDSPSPTMIIETSRLSNGYVLGFRSETLPEILNETTSAFRIAIDQPTMGVEVTFQEAQPSPAQAKQPRVFDDIEIVEPQYAGQGSASVAYLVSEVDRSTEIVFSPEIGLAIEKPPNNMKISTLWRVI